MTDFRPAGWTGTPAGGDPDVRPVGWVTEQPGVTIRRRRSPVLLAIGVLLVAAGAIGMTVSIVGLATTSAFDDEDVVAEGVVAALDADGGDPATFTSGGADPFTVWIQTDGIHEENRRENVIAATACEAYQGPEDVDPASFQGNRQGTAVTVGDDSTVGWFTAEEGEVSVVCHQEPFGQRRTRSWLDDEHDFLVVAGKPSAPWGSVIVLTAAIGALVVGIFVLGRWFRGRIQPV